MERLLRTFQVITHRSYLGYPMDKKQLNALSKKASSEEVAEEESEDLETAFRTSQRLENNEQIPTVMQYVETVTDETTGERLGWLLFYISYDPGYSFDLAFMNFCDVQQGMGPKVRQKQLLQPLRTKPFDSVQSWIQEALNNYTGSMFWGATTTANAALLNPLNSKHNPAQFESVFTLERALTHLETLRNVRRTKINYLVFDAKAIGAADVDVDSRREAAELPDEVPYFGQEGKKEKGREEGKRQSSHASSSSSSVSIPRSPSLPPRAAAPEDSTAASFTVQFPFEQAYQVPLCKKGPAMFFRIPLDEMEREAAVDPGETEVQKAFRLRKEREQLENPADAPSAFEAAQLKISEKLGEFVALERNEGAKTDQDDSVIIERARRHLFKWMRTQKPAEQLLHSALSSDTNCPATLATYKWYQDQLEESAKMNQKFSLVKPHEYAVNQNLTPLGNFLARDLLKIESSLGIIHLHSELIMLLIAALGAFDIEAPGGLAFHALFSGPPSSGKSNLLKVLADMLISGTTETVSHVTKLGFTTEANWNGKILTLDEALATMGAKKDIDYVEHLKQIMTDGRICVSHPHINENTGRREEIRTCSNKRVMILGNLNQGYSEFEQMMKPVLDRAGKFFAPIRNPEGKNVINVTCARADDPKMNLRRKAYSQEWQIQQFVASVLYALIRLDVIPSINTFVPQVLGPLVIKVLADTGFAVDNRDYMRLMIFVKQVCIKEAISKVFFTDDVFQAGKPFRLADVLECVPHLYCTREQFWVALGLLFPMFVNPHVDRVIEAMWEIITEQTQRHPELATGGIDYNAYLLDLSGNMMNYREQPKKLVARLVEQRMKGDGREILSVENVLDVLNWLETRGSFSTHSKFDGPGDENVEESPVSVKRKIIRSRQNGKGYGLEVSRAFMQSRVDEEGKIKDKASYANILERCFRATMFTSEEIAGIPKERRYITGMVEDRQYGRPFIFDVVKPEWMVANLSNDDEFELKLSITESALGQLTEGERNHLVSDEEAVEDAKRKQNPGGMTLTELARKHIMDHSGYSSRFQRAVMDTEEVSVNSKKKKRLAEVDDVVMEDSENERKNGTAIRAQRRFMLSKYPPPRDQQGSKTHVPGRRLEDMKTDTTLHPKKSARIGHSGSVPTFNM